MTLHSLIPPVIHPKIAGVGKLHVRFTRLFEGPDGAAYIPRWDIRPESVSHDDVYGFVLQKVRRRWEWCPFVLVATDPPIEVNALRKWRPISAKQVNHHEHILARDDDGLTGMEG